MKRLVFLLMGFMCVFIFMGMVAADRGLEIGELKPELPTGYLELGEWVLLDDVVGRDERLAVELLVRGVFWGDQTGDARIASSACIALAEVVDDVSTRRWLWDLALVVDPSRENEWVRVMEIEDRAVDVLSSEAGRCLYAIRYHQQPIGEELFGRADVRARIYVAGEMIGIDPDDLRVVIEQEIRRGDQDSCRGRLYVADRENRGQRLVCPDHLRGLGMCANDEELQMLLKVEMVLGGVEPESWARGAALGMDGAVLVPTIGDLVRLFRVEPGKAFYRDGRWVRTP